MLCHACRLPGCETTIHRRGIQSNPRERKSRGRPPLASPCFPCPHRRFSPNLDLRALVRGRWTRDGRRRRTKGRGARAAGPSRLRTTSTTSTTRCCSTSSPHRRRAASPSSRAASTRSCRSSTPSSSAVDCVIPHDRRPCPPSPAPRRIRLRPRALAHIARVLPTRPIHALGQILSLPPPPQSRVTPSRRLCPRHRPSPTCPTTRSEVLRAFKELRHHLLLVFQDVTGSTQCRTTAAPSPISTGLLLQAVVGPSETCK